MLINDKRETNILNTKIEQLISQLTILKKEVELLKDRIKTLEDKKCY